MMDSLQLPILIAALAVMSWAVVRLSSQAKSATGSLEVPPEVLGWQTDLRSMSQALQAELDEKMAAVSALSRAYDQASQRLHNLIQEAEQLEGEFKTEDQIRLSA